jgi:uncharacterized membrane protein YhaH (DUF805 family)
MANLIDLLTSFHSRISRKQWWIGFVIVFFGNLLGGLWLNPEFFTSEELPPPSWPDTIWQLAWLVPATAITVKCFNDRDWPSWFGYVFAAIGVLFYLAPHFRLAIYSAAIAIRIIVVSISAAFLLFAFVDNGFIRGMAGPNRYGPDPLAGSVQPA